MKYILASIAALAISCTTNPPIIPEPSNVSTGVGGFGGNGGAGGMDVSSSVASSSASGSSGLPLPGNGSGARLKRYVYTSDDGLSAGASGRFYDTLLAADCSPYATPNGIRCMTHASVFSLQHYADAACSTPVVYAYKGCQAPPYTITSVGTACATQPQWRAYSIAKSNATIMYQKSNICAVVAYDPTLTYDVYDLGPAIDYSQFAAMTLEHE